MGNIRIIGAGMAGLLAGSMLRSGCYAIHERQDCLPSNHSAVLRFRTDAVGQALNIPFRRERVVKAIDPHSNPIADQVSYSLKTNGTASLRSIATATGQTEDRFIAPDDFITRMADMCSGSLCLASDFFTEASIPTMKHPTISTIPMPVLMKLLGWPERLPAFQGITAHNVSFEIEDCDMYASLYVPDPGSMIGRISITGNRMIIECVSPLSGDDVNAVTIEALERCGFGLLKSTIGIPSVRVQDYAKIVPIDDRTRKRFIMWATDKFNIYSLGRFATWRPGLLLDDVVNDVRVISRMIDGDLSYDMRKETKR